MEQKLIFRGLFPMFALYLRKIGNSLGGVLPKEALASLKAAEGDEIYLTDSPDGGFRITPLNAAFAGQFKEAERIMREDRDGFPKISAGRRAFDMSGKKECGVCGFIQRCDVCSLKSRFLPIAHTGYVFDDPC